MISKKYDALTCIAISAIALTAFSSAQASAKTMAFEYSGALGSGSFTMDSELIPTYDYYRGYIYNATGIFALPPDAAPQYEQIIYMYDPTYYNGVALSNYNASYFGTGIKPFYATVDGAGIVQAGEYDVLSYANPVNYLYQTAPARFSVKAMGGPGAPAPEVGVGLLSALVAGLGLALTRMRSNPFAGLLNRRRAALA